MPWNTQNGGGGWKSGGGGPWGSGPSGGGGPQPPDLEEILRRGQDKLKTILPSGRGGNRFLIPIILVVLLLGWGSQSVYQVGPNELGVEFFLGKPKEEISTEGLHFVLWPVERIELTNIEQRRESIGVSAPGRGGRNENLMLSGDQNIVDVEFTVLWRVQDPAAFLINVREPQDAMRRVAEAAMREYVGRSRAEDIRTQERQALEETVRTLVQDTLDSYGSGVIVEGVQLERADPPPDVADAFEEVQRAQQDQEKFKQDAQAYANKRLGDARGEASQIREQGKGYRERVIAEAQGQASRFDAILQEYAKAKDVTRRRLYLETMERVLGRSNKVIIEDTAGASSGVVPYLPLPEVAKRRQAGEQQ